MEDDLTKKVDSLVSQMDVFSKQIEQYLHENINEGEIVDTDDEDVDVQYFKITLNDLMDTPGYSMLRDYQKYGIKWLMTLHTSGLNGIIADEMGLGKTLQVIKFLTAIKNQNGIVGPHIMIGPLSVLSNWYHEIEKYAPGEFDIHVHYGSKKERDECLKVACREWRSNKNKKVKKSTKIKIIITTFQIALHDHQTFKNISKWYGKSMEYLILDEAHRIKNESCVLYKQLRYFPITHRLLLTGTPLQNNLQELWALLKFLVPQLFPKHEDIHDWFNNVFHIEDSALKATDSASDESQLAAAVTDCPAPSLKNPSRNNSKLFATKASRSITSAKSNSDLLQSKDKEKIVHSLHRVLKPFILRRVKADVAIDIPHKVIKVIKCPLSALQRETLRILRLFVEETIKKQHTQNTKDSTGGNSIPRQLSALLKDSVHDDIESFSHQSLCKTFMTARKICNHPYLVLEEFESFSDEIYFQNVVEASGKMMVLDQLLRYLLPRGSKILIFSQFTTTLDIIGSYLSSIECGYYRIDGATNQATRQEYIDSFNHPPSTDPVQVFLLTTPSGGVGINLQAADTVILFDQDWNPQQDLQAISRAHRLGQQNPVLVLRLISAGIDDDTSSIEEMMFEKAMRKLQANKTILKNGIFATASRKLLKHAGCSSGMSSRPSLSHILDEDDVTSIAISSTGANETSLSNEDIFEDEDDFLAIWRSAGEDATTVDHEEAMTKIRDEECPFQWQSLFMQRTNDAKAAASHRLAKDTDSSPIKSFASHNNLNNNGYRITHVHVADPTVVEQQPCCRARVTVRLPVVRTPWERGSITLVAHDNNSTNNNSSSTDGWSFVCDRSPEISLPHHPNHYHHPHHLSQTQTQNHHSATLMKVPLPDDDFVEMSITFAMPRDTDDRHLLTTFATQLTRYRRSLLPQQWSSPPAMSPTDRHRLPRFASRRAEHKLCESEHTPGSEDEWRHDGNSRHSSGGTPTRKRKSKWRDDDEYVITYNVEESEIDDDDDVEGYKSSRRKRRRIKSVRSKNRKPSHHRPSMQRQQVDIVDDDDDQSDVCVLCHEAALDESDYWALLGTTEGVKEAEDGDHEDIDKSVKPTLDRDRLQTLLLCDGCDGAYHLVCVGLERVPDEDWFCALCRSAAMLSSLEHHLPVSEIVETDDDRVVNEAYDEEEVEEEELEDECEEEESYRPEENDDMYDEEEDDDDEEEEDVSDEDY